MSRTHLTLACPEVTREHGSYGEYEAEHCAAEIEVQLYLRPASGPDSPAQYIIGDLPSHCPEGHLLDADWLREEAEEKALDLSYDEL